MATDRGMGRRGFLAAFGGGIAAASLGATGCGDDEGSGDASTTTGAATSVPPPVVTSETDDAAFIVKFEPVGAGPRLAVKDLIDVAGVVTTAGSRAVAESAVPAESDAACMAGARAADAQLVGKTNLTELAYDARGVVNSYDRPVNPRDATLIPGGSSHGSAVAVAEGTADIAYGTDTAGSVRIPAACCGVAGLKTTFGRISTEGVYPLSPSLDVVGPIARDIAGLAEGMQLLEESFGETTLDDPLIGRVRGLAANVGLTVDPGVDEAIDAALTASGFRVEDVDLRFPPELIEAFSILVFGEGARGNEPLLARRDLLQVETGASIELGLTYTDEQVAASQGVIGQWRETVNRSLGEFDLLALPTLPFFPPPLEAVGDPRTAVMALTSQTAAWNAAGVPALAMPVPAAELPASLQLVGGSDSEEVLLAAGAVVESAVGS